MGLYLRGRQFWSCNYRILTMLKIPKVRMAIVLFALSLAALVRFFSFDLLFRFLAIVSITLSAEYAFWRFRKITPFVPSAGIVTALIVFLLSEPSSSSLGAVVAILFAVGVKQFFRPGNTHIFNPAALGLLSGSFFGLVTSWWGIGWGYFPLFGVLACCGYVSFVYARQYLIILPFLTVSILLTIISTGNPMLALNQLLIGPFWFFILVMLPEPMTAARFPKTKVAYGIFLAMLPFLVSKLRFSADPLLFSLLIGNYVFRIIEQKGEPTVPSSPQNPTQN